MAQDPAGALLIRTKLHPPVRRGALARPKLLAVLTGSPSPRLALLRAPAGAGKTTLLTEWADAEDERRRFAWLALDAGDNDPTRFWSYVIEALRCVAPSVRRRGARAAPRARSRNRGGGAAGAHQRPAGPR